MVHKKISGAATVSVVLPVSRPFTDDGFERSVGKTPFVRKLV